MEIHTDRRYRFEVPAEQLWSALTSVDEYAVWWPWLRHFEAAGFAAGAVWACEVQPPLPYSLRFDVLLDEVVDGQMAAATVRGDIVGQARLEVDGDGAGSRLHLESWLRPASVVLRTVSALGRPVARFGHDWVIDTGLRQFERRAL
ncbi:hypothetical protein BH20ACT3_BH20ACT3_00560 [soil metagenome]